MLPVVRLRKVPGRILALLGKGLDLHISVLSGERAQVIGIASGDNSAAKPDRGGDNQGIDGVARI